MPVPGGPPGRIAPNGTLTPRTPTYGDPHRNYGQGALARMAAMQALHRGTNFTKGSSIVTTSTSRPAVKRIPVPMVTETLIAHERRKHLPTTTTVVIQGRRLSVPMVTDNYVSQRGRSVVVTRFIPGRRVSVPVVTDNLLMQRRVRQVPGVTTTTVIHGRRLSVPVVSDNIVFQRGKSKVSVQIVNVAHLVPGRRYAYPVYGDELFTSE